MIRLDIDTAGVALVQLDRPEKKNALTGEMIACAAEIFRELAVNDEVRVVILTSTGADFCAGADLGESGSGGIAGSLGRIGAINRMIHELCSIPKPVIAAVSGVCIGVGWSLALACDFVLTAPEARFQFAFVNIGLAPDGAAAYLLTRQVGSMRAKELIYSGRAVSGVEAERLGLALEVSGATQLRQRASEFAAELTRAAPLAMAMAKRQLDAAGVSTLEQALAAEQIMQPLLARSEDFGEGVRAFRERRAPLFTGR